MGVLDNFSFKGGVDVLKQKLQSPLDRFRNADKIKQELKAAHERNDFTDGLVITPYNKDGVALKEDVIRLLADAMPHDAFKFGGQQRIVKDYYPGNSEPTVQILGPQENDITITGRFKSKHIKPAKLSVSNQVSMEDRELFRRYPVFLQEQVDAIRVAGLLVSIELGEWRRFGFIQEASFDLKTLADIDYSITFLVVGFNKPKDYIVVSKLQTIPYNTNKQLANLISSQLATQFGQAPDEMPQSFADQINGAISDVAAAVNLVTGFVDTILAEVDSLKASVERAKGLIKNARNKITGYQRTIGGRNPEGDVAKSTSISGSVNNANYVAAVSSSMNGIMAMLALLALQINAITVTQPIARHRVQAGNTLQNLAVKYYNDATKWDQIYDHNKLTSTELVVGVILEIPRV